VSWAFHFSRVLDFRTGGTTRTGVLITQVVLLCLVGTMAPVTAIAQTAPQPTTQTAPQSTMQSMTPSAAALPNPSSADSDSLPVFEIKKKPWLAATEVIGINLLIWSYNRFLRESGQNPGFRIGFNSWEENILNGFEWDDNSFSTNQFAHPYHGNLYFNAARSNGYGFWGSMPFAFAGSWMWEYIMETHHPSINDWVATAFGGSALGETTHRLSAMVFDNTATGGSRFWKELGGFLINPMGGLNRMISGEAFDVYANPPDRFPSKLQANYEIGFRTIGENRVWESDTTRVYMEMDFYYGDPFAGDVQKPFDSFDFNLQLNFNDKSFIGRAQAKGIYFASVLQESERTQHLVAAYQHYDYINNWAFEFGGQSISASYLSKIELGRSSLTTEFHGLGMILGATKSDYENFTGRSYDYGPGLGFEFQSVLHRQGRPFFTIGTSSFWIHVLNGNDANHFVSFTWARLDLQIRNFFGVGFEYDLYYAERHYDDFEDVSQRNPEFRVFFSWILD